MKINKDIPSLSFRNAELRCCICGESFLLDSFNQRCSKCDNEPLEVHYDMEKLRMVVKKESLKERPLSVWKYFEFLPIESFDHVVTLSEGGTPLHKAKNLGKYLNCSQLLLKDETQNPTNSFKDRGSSVGVTRVLDFGARIHATGTVSTGNMAASMAAFAAKAQLPCFILIQPNTSMAKVAQTAICGVHIVSVAGPYGKLYEESLKIGQEAGILFINSDSPWRIEGQKTVAYEIVDQLNWQIPDYLLVPVSSGGNISAIFKGFWELHETGLITQVPHIIGVQAEGNCPIAQAFIAGKDVVKEFSNPSTIAHAITNPSPPSGNRVLRLLKRFRGQMITVNDKEILEAQRLLASQEGIFAEPAGATPVAALKRLRETGIINKEDRIVCVITGHGLKDISVVIDQLPKPTESKLEDLELTLKSLLWG